MGGVRRNNQASILKLINQTGPISKKDIAEYLGLTPAAVTMLCNDLFEQGVLIERGFQQGEAGRAGRKKVSIDINEEYGYIYSINIDSHNTSIAICNAKGGRQILCSIPTTRDLEPEMFFQNVLEECEKLRKKLHLKENQILGAGIGVPGDVDPEEGLSLNTYGIWNGVVPVKAIFSELLGNKTVVVENNVNEFATAELLFGKGREADSFLVVKWGPGVGSAIVYDRVVYEGSERRTAEVGHMIVKPNGRNCRCGKKGCLEAYLSSQTIAEELGSFQPETFGDFVSNLPENQKAHWQELVQLFAQNIVNSAMLLGIHEIVLFGDLFADTRICDAVVEATQEMAGDSCKLSMCQSKLIDQEGAIGPAAYFILRQCLQL